MTEQEGEATQQILASIETMLGHHEEVSHNCSVCGGETYHEPDHYGDYYCSIACYEKDTGIKVTCSDCKLTDCRCCWEEFFERGI